MDDPLAEIHGRLGELERECAGLRETVVALALALCGQDADAARRTQTFLALKAVEGKVMHDPPIDLPARATLDQVASLTRDGADPQKALTLRLVLAADAGADRRLALKTWLSQASVEEVAEDLLALLRRLHPGLAPGGADPTGSGR